MPILQTDFQEQSINALNQGLGIGNAIQRTKQIGIDRQRQSDMDVQRNQRFESQQGIMGQQSTMNQQAIDQNEKTKSMGDLLTSIGIENPEKRNDFISTVRDGVKDPAGIKFLDHILTLDDNDQMVALLQVLNSQHGGGQEDGRTSSIKDFEYYSELKRTDPEAAMEFGKANKIISEVGNVIMKTADVNTINKGVGQLTSEYKGVRSAAKDLDRLGKLKSAPAQMAMIFKFMKALDPGSTVRETEYASAANTTGIPERVMNMYNKAKDGQMLNEVQVNEFINVSKTLANAKGENVRATVSDYLNTYDITDARKERFMKTARVNPFEITSAKPKERTDGVLSVDANGNKAMVYPDGTFKEL